MPGVLANVDYEDALTKFRVREVIFEAKRCNLNFVENIPREFIADAFYVHYKAPIFRSPSPDEGLETSLWRFIISTYVKTDSYNEVFKLTRFNGKLSRIMALKLLRVYNSVMNKSRRSDAFKRVVEGALRKGIQSDRASLEREVKSLISFYVGTMRRVSETVDKVKSVFGDSIGHEVATALLSTDIDPYRLRLVSMLNSLVKLIVDSKHTIDVSSERYPARMGIVAGVKRMSTPSELRDLTPTERALLYKHKGLFAYKLAFGNVHVKEKYVDLRPKLYILIDKSGSMFYSAGAGILDGEAISKITWATALAVVLTMKGGDVIVRFFDQQVYPALTNKRGIIRALLSLIPLGGTDITNAVETAIKDAEANPSLRQSKLVLITDGEDDAINPKVLEKAKLTFKSFKALLIGGENRVIERHIDSIKIDDLNGKSLAEALKRI